jgi:hypothetical protein
VELSIGRCCGLAAPLVGMKEATSPPALVQLPGIGDALDTVTLSTPSEKTNVARPPDRISMA